MNIKPSTINLNELNEKCSMEIKDTQFYSMQCKNDNFKSLFLHCTIVVCKSLEPCVMKYMELLNNG
jgi:hypothetical protein